MRLDAQENVGELVDRVDAVRLARGDERVEASQVLSCLVVADEEEVLSPQGSPRSCCPSRGTEVAANFYSLIESAKLAGIEPHAYLREAARAGLRGERVPLPYEIARA